MARQLARIIEYPSKRWRSSAKQRSRREPGTTATSRFPRNRISGRSGDLQTGWVSNLGGNLSPKVLRGYSALLSGRDNGYLMSIDRCRQETRSRIRFTRASLGWRARMIPYYPLMRSWSFQEFAGQDSLQKIGIQEARGFRICERCREGSVPSMRTASTGNKMNGV